MFDQFVGTTAKCPKMLTDGALSDDVTAATAAVVDALWAAVVRVLDEDDTDLVHLLQYRQPSHQSTPNARR